MTNLKTIYRQIPKSKCPPNCGKCCGSLFPSMAELTNIKTYCEKRNIKYKEFICDGVSDCPYLKLDKSCEIYEVRPFLCRILGVSDDLPCPLHLNTPEKVLNHNESRIIYRDIYLRGKEKPRTEKHRELIKYMLGIT